MRIVYRRFGVGELIILPRVSLRMRTISRDPPKTRCPTCGKDTTNYSKGGRTRWKLLPEKGRNVAPSLIWWPKPDVPVTLHSGPEFRSFLAKWIQRIPEPERKGIVNVDFRVENDPRDGHDYMTVAVVHIPGIPVPKMDPCEHGYYPEGIWSGGEPPDGFPKVLRLSP